MRWYRRLTPGAVATLSFLLFLLVAYACYVTYLANIPFASGVQQDYLIDAYYYVYLAQEALRVTSGTALGLSQIVADLQPNASSFGVVMLASLSLAASRAIELLPALMALLLFWATWRLYSRRYCNGSILLLPFSGLFPYYFLPSKELFCIVALMTALVGMLRGGWALLSVIPAFFVLYLARPEAAGILLAAVLVWAAIQSRPAIVLLGACAIAAYANFGRESAHALSTIFQLQSDQVESAFCNVGPFNVCVGDIGSLEQIYAQRLVTLTFLPVKWMTDVLTIPFLPGLLVTEKISRFFVGLQVFYIVATWIKRSPVNGTARQARGILLSFAALYGLTYGCVLYFQPTRQLVLATTVMCIALSIQNRPHSFRTANANPAPI